MGDADATLAQVAWWLRRYHDAVADFVPPAGAVWRMGGQWRPGLIIGHNDTAPYNAVWRDGRLAGFFDWDMAGPVTVAQDISFAAFSWVPLHARHVVTREGFTEFAPQAAAIAAVPGQYGWTGAAAGFLDVVRDRVRAHVATGCAVSPRPAIRCSPGWCSGETSAAWMWPWPNSNRSVSSGQRSACESSTGLTSTIGVPSRASRWRPRGACHRPTRSLPGAGPPGSAGPAIAC